MDHALFEHQQDKRQVLDNKRGDDLEDGIRISSFLSKKYVAPHNKHSTFNIHDKQQHLGVFGDDVVCVLSLDGLDTLLGVLQLVHEILKFLNGCGEKHVLALPVVRFSLELNHVHQLVNLIKSPALLTTITRRR
jgi:hypothetical protein